jgi:hypothetical protein
MRDIDLFELKNQHETVGLIFSLSALWNVCKILIWRFEQET